MGVSAICFSHERPANQKIFVKKVKKQCSRLLRFCNMLSTFQAWHFHALVPLLLSAGRTESFYGRQMHMRRSSRFFVMVLMSIRMAQTIALLRVAWQRWELSIRKTVRFRGLTRYDKFKCNGLHSKLFTVVLYPFMVLKTRLHRELD